MPHTPQPPFNPCSLNENELLPAKVWELLRRNERFNVVVERLQDLDRRVKAEENRIRELKARGVKLGQEDEQGEELLAAVKQHGGMWGTCYRRIGALKKHHPLAGLALEWLVPEPQFRIARVELPKNLDLTGKRSVSLDFVTLGFGTTPDPKDRKHWRWFRSGGGVSASSRHNLSGGTMRRGPTVAWQTSSNPRFCSKVNPIQEWRDYFAEHTFNLNTSWHEAPPPAGRHSRHGCHRLILKKHTFRGGKKLIFFSPPCDNRDVRDNRPLPTRPTVPGLPARQPIRPVDLSAP